MKIWVGLFVVVWFSCSPQRTLGADNPEPFARKYLHARTEKQKLDLCVKIIDKGVLYPGSPVGELRKIFQKDFQEMGHKDSTDLAAIVHFVQTKPPAIPGEAVDWGGWYLSIKYRQDGTVLHYCLSNESKETSMKWMYEKQSKAGINRDAGLPVLEPARGGRQ
jgi:hypothetical protein